MISFKSIKAGFEIKEPAFFRNWLKEVILKETEKKVGDIQYIFCNDNYLLNINMQFLNHDTLTDIITFPSQENTEKKIITGEIYISIDRISENKTLFKNEFNKELSRIMVHGLLHLLGYNDGTPEEKLVMRQKEDYYLNLQP